MSHRRGSTFARAVAVGLGLLAATALPTRAQQQIPIGSSVTGTLSMSDPTLGDGSHYKLFTFMGAAGQSVQIDLMSSDFDSYLYLKDQNGTEITHDDDSGGGLNARIVRTLGYTGMYQIYVNTLRSGQYGAFTLRLQSAAAVSQPVVTPIVTGASIAPIGTIGLNQQVQNNLVPGGTTYDGKPIHTYNFQCTAGQAFQMDVLSDWDNYAIVFDPMGNNVAHDDDGGEGLNARITYTCQQTAVYKLAVTTYSASTTTGLYTLRVQALGTPTPLGQPTPIGQPQPIAQPIPQPIPAQPTNLIAAPGQTAQIGIGQTMRGRLETGDQIMQDSTYADLWQFQGTAGQTVQIDVRSDEFDTYMQLLDANGTKLGEDDDSGGNLNSRLIFTLPATGMYQIVVNNAGRTRRAGIYTVSITAR
ncbi:MAG TPA: PPC domain-containing protein [Gemmatimonadales bacterium]|nr:PPC domain-containing protein [Gemmatimonadales bacterium]